MKRLASAALAIIFIISAVFLTSCSEFFDALSTAFSDIYEDTTVFQSSETQTSEQGDEKSEFEPEIIEYVIPSEDFADSIEKEASDIIDSAIEKAVSYVNALRNDGRSHLFFAYDEDANGYIAKLTPSEERLYRKIIEAAGYLSPFTVTEEEFDGDLKKAYFSIYEPLTYCEPGIASYAFADASTYLTQNYQSHYKSVYLFYFDPYKDGNSRLNDTEKLAHDAELLERIVRRVVRFMPEGLSTYDKYYYLAAVLSEHVSYDSRPENAFTAFGALVCKRAVCEGYTSAFMLLCREAGLWCAYRNGQPENSGHTWNMVRLESGIYNVDVTWCDVTDACREKWFDCFMKSDADFVDHEITSGVDGTGTFEPSPYEASK